MILHFFCIVLDTSCLHLRGIMFTMKAEKKGFYSICCEERENHGKREKMGKGFTVYHNFGV